MKKQNIKKKVYFHRYIVLALVVVTVIYQYRFLHEILFIENGNNNLGTNFLRNSNGLNNKYYQIIVEPVADSSSVSAKYINSNSNDSRKPEVEVYNNIEKDQRTIINDNDMKNTKNDLELVKNVAIFYHTFLKPNQDEIERENSLEIIRDQIRQVRSQPLLLNQTLYYTRMGDLNQPFPDCGGPCEEIVAPKEGFEEVTIQTLYDYCLVHSNDRVVYMHSKGTYTPTDTNNNLRNVLTSAILNRECYNMNDACNVCSTQFSISPAHYVGNMWVADCSYIKKLVPPTEFGVKKWKIAQDLWDSYVYLRGENITRYLVLDSLERDLGQEESIKYFNEWQRNSDPGSTSLRLRLIVNRIVRRTYLNFRPCQMGIARYSMEHWIASHPDLEPCEVYGVSQGFPEIQYILDDTRDFLSNDNNLLVKRQVANPSHQNQIDLIPWHSIEGREYLFDELYSRQPLDSSWFRRAYNVL